MMLSQKRRIGGTLFLIGSGFAGAAQADCKGPPFFIPGNLANIEVALTVKAGTSCIFGVSGVPGAISEVKITQIPKNGRAGVENLRAYYVAKSAYEGSDEFTYTIIGTDQYGGPMRVSIKRKVTIVPSL
jgi:hypothetical protein